MVGEEKAEIKDRPRIVYSCTKHKRLSECVIYGFVLTPTTK